MEILNFARFSSRYALYLRDKIVHAASILLWAAVPGALSAQAPTLVREIGDERTNYSFHRIQDIAVDADGRIAVLDVGDKAARVYSANGMFMYTFGREGGGPGEFQIPTAIKATKNGWEVIDPRASTRSTFSNTGKHVMTESIPRPGGVVLGEAVALAHKWVLGRTMFRASLGSPMHDPFNRLVLFRDGTPRIDTLATFSIGAAVWRVPGKVAPWGGVPLQWLGSGGALAVSHDSVVAIADGVVGTVTFYSVTPEGLTRIRTVNFGSKAGPIPAARMLATRDSLRKANKQPTAVIDAPSQQFAIRDAALFDDTGVLWIEMNSQGSINEWSRIHLDGRTEIVRFPASFRLKTISRGRLYGIWKDELDVQTVRVYQLGR